MLKLMFIKLSNCLVLFMTLLTFYVGVCSAYEKPEILPFDTFVLRTKLIKFNEEISNAYNASIIEKKNGYSLIFRHDLVKKWCTVCSYKKPQIKMVSLDKHFNQISSIKTILPDASLSEDARLHSLKGQLCITYNDDPQIVYGKRIKKRSIKKGKNHSHSQTRRLFLGKLSQAIDRFSDITMIPSGTLDLADVEKNWTPFEYPEKSGNLYYIYKVSPYQIIQIDTFKNQLIAKNLPTLKQNVYRVWDKVLWGEIRGGSPARLVDDIYIVFFHSWRYFPKLNCFYYVMGAYTFEAKPPFKILSMTPKPIFFPDIYSAPHRVDHLHTIYPAGFAIEKKQRKTLLHVSCGENDTSIRIVTIDKDALLKSMVHVS